MNIEPLVRAYIEALNFLTHGEEQQIETRYALQALEASLTHLTEVDAVTAEALDDALTTVEAASPAAAATVAMVRLTLSWTR